MDPRETGKKEVAGTNGSRNGQVSGPASPYSFTAFFPQASVADPAPNPERPAGAASQGPSPSITEPLSGQPPGAAELMPRERPRKSGGAGGRARKGRGAKEGAKFARPQAARQAAREEIQDAQVRRAQGMEREPRSLPARRRDVEPRGGYVMGVANPCRSCGLAVWVAGKDARGKWIKVNLDGSPHICGAAMMAGMPRYPMPYAMPPQPMLPPGAPYVAPPPAASPSAARPVVDQGQMWRERFMVVVAVVALAFLSTFPRQNGGSPARDQAVQSAGAQRVSTAPPLGIPAAAAGARAEAPKKESFSLGSTEDDVMAVMGPPREIFDNRWWYGSSYVDFKNGRVVNFYNSIHAELKVKMHGTVRNRPAYLAKGLTKDEVFSLQGTPTRLEENRWHYGSSYVDFKNDRVSDYFNGVLKELKVSARQ